MPGRKISIECPLRAQNITKSLHRDCMNDVIKGGGEVEAWEPTKPSFLLKLSERSLLQILIERPEKTCSRLSFEVGVASRRRGSWSTKYSSTRQRLAPTKTGSETVLKTSLK